MKTLPNTHLNERKFPLVEYHYHAPMLKGSGLTRLKTSKSLRDITRDYFDAEANCEFTTETAVFGTLIVMAMVPIMTGISAVLQVLHDLPLPLF
jgi:hypothetical protein